MRATSTDKARPHFAARSSASTLLRCNRTPHLHEAKPLEVLHVGGGEFGDGEGAEGEGGERTDGWLMGGTRLESEELPTAPQPDGATLPAWQGETYSGKTIAVPLLGKPDQQISVPAPILELNRTLIQRLTGTDPLAAPLGAMEGYRHKRRTVRLERADFHSRPLIHNYGHGGAGVTLSWSCAVKSAALLSQGDGNSFASLPEIEARLLEEISGWR